MRGERSLCKSLTQNVPSPQCTGTIITACFIPSCDTWHSGFLCKQLRMASSAPAGGCPSPQPGQLSLHEYHVSVNIATVVGQVRKGSWRQAGPQGFSLAQRRHLCWRSLSLLNPFNSTSIITMTVCLTACLGVGVSRACTVQPRASPLPHAGLQTGQGRMRQYPVSLSWSTERMSCPRRQQ